MKILAVIPARANSARVPGKNTMRLGPDSKPNLVRAIEAVRECEDVATVAVVSDDGKTRKIADFHDCLALKEPPHVAKGDLYDVMDFVLRSIKSEWDAVILAYPNVPIRPPGLFPRLAATFAASSPTSIAAIAPDRHHGGGSIFAIDYLRSVIENRNASSLDNHIYLNYRQDELVEIDDYSDVTWALTLLKANAECEPQPSFR